jgi:pSer/pThr/pTyr-binding forkhead associated (FHA) protein
MNSEASASTITLTIENGPSAGMTLSRVEPFQIGRHPDCALCIQQDVVSRYHAELYMDNNRWWIKDLNSANGILVNGEPVAQAPLSESDRFQLGSSGPQFSCSITSAQIDTSTKAQSERQPWAIDKDIVSGQASAADLDHYKQHYFTDTDGRAAGEHTMLVRQAFAEVRKIQRRTYGIIIGLVVLLLMVTGGLALYNHNQVVKQRKLATEIFYTLKALDINLMKLKHETLLSHALEAKIQYDAVKNQKQKLEKSYQRYMESLNVYGKGLGAQEKIILRMARHFGECEINMPKGFAAEVSDFIENWKSSQRLSKVVKKAKRQGYIPKIVKAMSDQELPAEFFYLAVQESNLDHRAVGPLTRFGIAKGMWQFIPSTAERYGLRTGPLKAEPVMDLLDERHHIQKSTLAAARYLRDIYTTDAQASGLLVMASYNWGEHRVIDLIRTMPANPQDRNFWELISKYRHKIPDETYDYVFSIFSAAVIGQNPRLFGFDFDNPLPALAVSE